ncbi:DUF1232 domain-containing protein [Paraclostridium sordellii]|uniref:PF06803 family protein n=1 Tax=Paraclostridium sordellii TaxID=1505 RepID=A0A9P1L158_PARSO|nr:DUF1232 domain-containing protein [Paeniclostridium sordellii]MDU5021394.1 DUF1232 domain-containing protein [Clostridiales bacterium]AUN15500.1 hypothetical protein RSJ16_15190 [Paeniclostridium sordellii]MCH1967442.1 DUF1232 domain-containing protein [Paeniclostridium sordellii]MCQ4697576.1 DUF1232 domain-containing protein [Paeniclostridium sordellii]MDU4413438.1 DUF1232 domain-containing protein [Paeniclostridium sordellii]
MKKVIKGFELFLDIFKKKLVKLKNNKFGISYLINLFKVLNFYKDKDVSLISKFKVTFSILIALIYLILGIDFIPEFLLGAFGFVDDLIVIIWSLGIVNNEIEKYKKLKKEIKNSNIIEGVTFSIKDE